MFHGFCFCFIWVMTTLYLIGTVAVSKISLYEILKSTIMLTFFYSFLISVLLYDIIDKGFYLYVVLVIYSILASSISIYYVRKVYENVKMYPQTYFFQRFFCLCCTVYLIWSMDDLVFSTVVFIFFVSHFYFEIRKKFREKKESPYCLVSNKCARRPLHSNFKLSIHNFIMGMYPE